MTALLVLGSIGWHVLDRFHIGSRIAISPHGLGIAIGFLAGAYLFVNREGLRRGYPEELSSSVVFWALIGTIVGSRVGYVITHLSEFHNVVDVLAVYRGGISLLGGIVGAIIAGYIVIRARATPGVSFVKGLDGASIPIGLGIVIGRVGDLIIGDHLGKPTSWALAFRYRGGLLSGYDCVANVCQATLSGGRVQTITRQGAILSGPNGEILGRGIGVHQTAFYDLFIAMGLVLLLVWLNRQPRRPGILIATFGLWYGTGRIITDMLRVENRFFGLTGSQWTSTVVVALCVATLIRYALRPERPQLPGDVEPAEPVEPSRSVEPAEPVDPS